MQVSRDVPGIDAAHLAMDTEDGVEVVWNEVRYSSRKAVAASKVYMVSSATARSGWCMIYCVCVTVCVTVCTYIYSCEYLHAQVRTSSAEHLNSTVTNTCTLPCNKHVFFILRVKA